MSDHKYRLTYSLEAHPEGLTKEELPEGHGACDALVIMSLIYPEDGSYSWDMTALDGNLDRDLTGDELWKAWLMLTKHLSIRDDMTGGKKELCHNVFHQTMAILNHVKSAKKDPGDMH